MRQGSIPEFTAASRAASADELRATLSRLPVLRARALRSLGDAVCRREPAAPSIGPALLVLHPLEGHLNLRDLDAGAYARAPDESLVEGEAGRDLGPNRIIE